MSRLRSRFLAPALVLITLFAFPGFFSKIWDLLSTAWATGSILDPNGVSSDTGSGLDPNGARSGDTGSILDPNG